MASRQQRIARCRVKLGEDRRELRRLMFNIERFGMNPSRAQYLAQMQYEVRQREQEMQTLYALPE